MSRVHDVIDNATNSVIVGYVLAVLGISEDIYVQSLKMPLHGQSVVHCNPSEVYTNGCNHEILHFWGANVDFWFVLDKYSTVMYASSYMMKSEKAMSEVLKCVSKECCCELVEEQLKKIGKASVSHHVVGASESAMCELSVWSMKQSRKVVFFNSLTCMMTMLVYQRVLVPCMIWKKMKMMYTW